MNNYSNMSGLDLFTDPFLRQPQVYNQPPVRSSSTAAPQPKMADAKLTQQKPVAAQAQQPNTVAKPTTPPKAPAPQEKTKAPELAQEQKTVATTPADTQSEPPKKALEQIAKLLMKTIRKNVKPMKLPKQNARQNGKLSKLQRSRRKKKPCKRLIA